MELNSQENLLAKLKKLQLERSEKSQFSSRLAFNTWADQVAGLLAGDSKAQQKFLYHVGIANFLQADNSPSVGSENEAIGVLNQVIFTLENAHLMSQQSMKKGKDSVRMHAAHDADENRNLPVNKPGPARRRFDDWMERPVWKRILDIAGTLLVAYLGKLFL